jgi:hypothetical protein
MRLRSLSLAGLALALASAAAPLRAEIYVLAHDEADNATVLRDPLSGFDSTGRVSDCCAIGVGTPTFDTVGDRAFFVAQSVSGPELVRFDYVAGSSQRLALDPAYTVTHLEFHAASAQLYALARDNASGELVMAAINPTTAQLTVRATIAAPCCELKAGVSALADSGNLLLLAVAKTPAGDEVIQLFDFSTNTLGGEIALPAELQLTDLVRHPASGTIWGFAHDGATALGGPIAIGLVPGNPVVPIGPGVAGCCYAQAGAAAIDQSSNALVFIGHDTAGNPSSLQHFNLSDGSHSVGASVVGHAVFQDFGLNFSQLFADGFEGP